MENSLYKKDCDSYCGTRYAAKLLGVSVGTVQNLVKRDQLEAWKTQGGHRRIALQSIHNYLSNRNSSLSATRVDAESKLRVFVVEDDDDTRVMYRACFDAWGIDSLEVDMYESCFEALLDMSTTRPHVLLTDLKMPYMSGFELIKVIKERKSFSNLLIIAVSGLNSDQIAMKGGWPNGVQLLVKPIDMEWLRGFFEALIGVYSIRTSL